MSKPAQVLGAFASRGNVKAELLARIILEAVVMAENACLFVDFVTTDAASWNRSMWRIFGIFGTAQRVVCKTAHPTDPARHLHFLSDFHHLIKNARNNALQHPFQTPEGKVSARHVEAAWECDQVSNVSLKAVPHVTKAVVKPNGFEKMRVNYAFRFFSDEVRRGLFLYKEDIECQHGSVDPTSAFVKLMQELISIMTSRFSAAALRPNRLKAEKLSVFLLYLDDWERIAGKNGFLSASTAEGLRVTISSTLSLLEYLTSKLGFRFLMTSRMSQDSLEQLFGVVRQMSGSNDHPTPVQFLLSLNTLSFMNLAKSPDSANVSSGLLSSLLCIDDSSVREKTTQKEVDQLLDIGNLEAAHEVLSDCELDHGSLLTEKSDSRLIFYVAGYVARKFVTKGKCEGCLSLLLMPKGAPHPAEASVTTRMSMGGLLYPSNDLNRLVSSLEDTFTHCFSLKQLKKNSLADFSSFLQLRPPALIGCDTHKRSLTNQVVKFYAIMRLHFLVKGRNSLRESARQAKSHLKMRHVL
ncbi:hypothetical protein ISCGN_003492 [Ixodes scapularis]